MRNWLGWTAGTKAVPLPNIPMPIVFWVQLIIYTLRLWNTESKEVWAELQGYRITQHFLCKNESGSEHEFIVVDMTNEKKQKLQLRVDRSAGERKDSRSASPSSSVTSFDTNSDGFLPPSPPSSPRMSGRRSPGSSLSIESVKEGVKKTTGFVRRTFRELSRSPGISSNQYFAADTVTKIDSFPKGAKIIRTIEFNSSDRSQRPSLWDVMILSLVIHLDSTTYELLDRQCFWFADTISAILEKWPETTVKHFPTRKASSGSVKGVVVHRRNLEDIERIWAQFLKERDGMNHKCQEFNSVRTNGVKDAEELEREMEELREQQDKERKEWEKERQEREERERQLEQKIIDHKHIQQQLQQRLEERNRRFLEKLTI